MTDAKVYQFPQPKPCTVDYLRVGSQPFTSLWAAEQYARETGIREIYFVPGRAAELSRGFMEVTRG